MASPTTIDVVVDELWITEVANIPINKPTTGFDVPAMSVSAKPFPNNFIEVLIRSMLKRKR
jgi:hypothetical protein